MRWPFRYIVITALVAYVITVSIWDRTARLRAETLFEVNSRILQLPLWNLDEDISRDQSRLIGRAEGYRSLQIFHEDNRLFVEIEEEYQQGPVDRFFSYLGLIRLHTFTRPMRHEGKAIGRIEVVWVNRNIYLFLFGALVLAMFLKLIHYYRRIALHRRELEQNNLMLSHQINERIKTERALSDEKERLAVTLGSIGDGVVASDTYGAIVLMNPAAEAMTGWSVKETEGKSAHDILQFVSGSNRNYREKPVEKALRTDRAVTLGADFLLIDREGRERYVVVSCAPIKDREGVTIGAVLIVTDVTEARKNEEDRIKISKLESISLLAGGIAHDFNNDLTAILGFVSLARHNTTPDDMRYSMLERAEEAVQHAKGLTRQLLSFARGGEPIKKLVSIKDLISSAAGLVMSGSSVRSELDLPDDLWWAEVDTDQIIQAVQNIVINARQVQPEGGRIRITGENTLYETPVVLQGITLQPGFYVKIKIQDDGPGIPQEYRAKIFDPYFSTKADGSGLGLTTTYTIIKRHLGAVTVESEPGDGATFSIYLPASSSRGVATAETKPPPNESPSKDAKTLRVLIMDDERLIRIMLDKSLTDMGYSVVCAADGDEMLEKYQQAVTAGAPFDVVVLDLTIPGGMGGREAIRRLLEIAPDVRAIVCSGYSNDPIMAHFEAYGFRGMLEKPFQARQLAALIEEIAS